MATDPDDVRFQGKTGSSRPTTKMTRLAHARRARYTKEADHPASTKGMRPCVSLSAMLYVIALHRRRDEHGVACQGQEQWLRYPQPTTSRAMTYTSPIKCSARARSI